MSREKGIPHYFCLLMQNASMVIAVVTVATPGEKEKTIINVMSLYVDCNPWRDPPS